MQPLNVVLYGRGVRKISSRLIAFILISAFVASGAGAEMITSAHFTDPVDRYGHFALGRPHEYACVTARTDAGRTLVLQLPEDEVFEDLMPRIIRLSADEPEELLAIVSRRNSGSRLVMVGLRGDHLEISAQSPAIGTPMRWLNPVGVVDLDGDGRAEIAAVITPHITGTLKVYQRQGRELVELSALKGFSNHVYRTTELALSAPISVAGKMRLLVPDATRTHLRIVGLENGRLVETGRCTLSAPVTGAIRVISSSEVSIGLLSGRQVIVPKDCPR